MAKHMAAGLAALVMGLLCGCGLPADPGGSRDVWADVLDESGDWMIEVESWERSPNGRCRIYDQREQLMLEGTLAQGRMDGEWKSFASTGQELVLLSYREGVREGPVRMWYGPYGFKEAAGRLKLEGAFRGGRYEGEVMRYHPSGKPRMLRVYENGALKTCQAWQDDGTEVPAGKRLEDAAAAELEADLAYLTELEGMVNRALMHARRKGGQ